MEQEIMEFGILNQIILGWLVMQIVTGLDPLMVEKALQVMYSTLEQVQYYGVQRSNQRFHCLLHR